MKILRPSALLTVGLVVVAAACSDQNGTPLAPEDRLSAPETFSPVRVATGAKVENSYIVVLKEGADPRSVAAITKVDPRYVYEAALNGFAATLDAAKLNALRSNPNVAYIEEDPVVSTATTQSISGDPWGLDRSDQRSSSLSKSYSYTSSGSGVYVYVIDTGIQADHPQFEGRAKNVFNAVGGTNSDCHGHGTAVAGIVGAKTYGVAKKAYLRGVKVFDCNGSGSGSALLAAIDWVRKSRANPAVVNLSLIGGYSTTVNTAVEGLVTAGIVVVAGAGNSNKDACNYSPASAPSALTAAASDKYDSKASYSNYGKCVDTYAPGSSIKTTHLGDGTARWTGTSMSAPHVAGVAALYRSRYRDASPSMVIGWIKSNATGSVIRNNPSGTPNRLLYKSSL